MLLPIKIIFLRQGLISTLLIIGFITFQWSTVFCVPTFAKHNKLEKYVAEDIVKLIERLRKEPTQGDIELASEILSRGLAGDTADDLLNEIRNLLRQTEHRNMILSAISLHSIVALDFDLAVAIPQITDAIDNEYINLILRAVQNSGGQICKAKIKAISSANFPTQPTIGQLSLRRKLWIAYSLLNRFEATSDALMFYGVSATGRWELENDPEAPALLEELVVSSWGDPVERVRLLTCFEFFIGKVESIFNLANPYQLEKIDVGSADSARNRILRLILAKITSKASPSPAELSVVLRFAESSDPYFSEVAKKFNYTNLENHPWLLPTGSYALSISQYVNSESFRTLKQLSLNIPVESTFIPESKWYALKGILPANPSKPQKNVLIEERLEINLLNRISSLYGIKIDETLNSAPPMGNPYFSIMKTFSVVSNTLSNAVEKTGIAQVEAKQLSEILTLREYERLSLTLYSLLSAKRRFGYESSPIDLSAADDELDKLSNLVTSPIIVKSEITNNILGDLSQFPIASQLPPYCGNANFTLTKRRFSFDQGAYEESLLANCQDGSQHQLSWIGSIPVSLVSSLRRHPRLLDFPSVSLSIRELKSQSIMAPPNVEDIDLVRNSPLLSINYLMSSLNDSDIKWANVRESLILETNYAEPWQFFREVDYPSNAFAPFLKPTEPTKKPYHLSPEQTALLDFGLPGGVGGFNGVVKASSVEEYKKKIDEMQLPLLYLISFRTQRLTAEKVRPFAEGIDVYKPCHPMDFLCHLGCCGYPQIDYYVNQDKNEFLSKIYQAIANGKATEDYLEAWDISATNLDKIVQIDLRQMLISPDYADFFATYEIKNSLGIVRYVNLEGKLAPLPEWLKGIIETQPGFLERYNIDLAASSKTSEQRLGIAALRAMNKKAGLLPVTKILELTGFYPLQNPYPNFTPSSLLFTTEEGRIRSAEMTVLSNIYTIGLGSDFPSGGEPKPEVDLAIKSLSTSIQKVVNEKSNSEAQPIIDKINQRKKDWSIFFSVTFSGGGFPTFGGGYNNGSAGLNLSTSLNGNVLLSGSVNGQNIPIFINPLDPFKANPKGLTKDSQKAPLDAALGSVPTKMATQGTIYRESASLQSAIALTTATAMATPPTFSTNPSRNNEITFVSTNWTDLPQLPINWYTQNLGQGQRVWLSGLIARSAPSLNQAEKDELFTAIKAGTFDDALIGKLVQKLNDVESTASLGNCVNLRTNQLDSILPKSVSDNLSEIELAQMLNDYNKQERNAFAASTENVRKELKTERVFVDGLPAVAITIGRKSKTILWNYDFKLVNGLKIKLSQLDSAPSWLIERMAFHNDAHYLEKLSVLSTKDLVGADVSPNSLLLSGEKSKFVDAEKYRSDMSLSINSSQQKVSDELRPITNRFYKELDTWLNSQVGTQNVSSPFIPPPLGGQFLTLFPPPFEIATCKDESLQHVLESEKASDINQQVKTGKLIIDSNPSWEDSPADEVARIMSTKNLDEKGFIKSEFVRPDIKPLLTHVENTIKTGASTADGIKVRTEINRAFVFSSVSSSELGYQQAAGAISLASSADVAFSEGNTQSGDKLLSLAKTLIDVGLGLAPIPLVGSINDIVQIVHGMATGKDYTGAEMKEADFALRGLGAVLGILPAGKQVVAFGTRLLDRAFVLGSALIRKLKIQNKLWAISEKSKEIIYPLTKILGELSASPASEVELTKKVNDTIDGAANVVQEFAEIGLQNKWSNAMTKGFTIEGEGVKVFNKVVPIINELPENGSFARVMKKDKLDQIKNGTALLSDFDQTAFITAADDLTEFAYGPAIAKRLGLFESDGKTLRNLDGHVIVEFSFNDTKLLALPVNFDKTYKGAWISGGKTIGGAREWLTNSDVLEKGQIKITNIKDIKPCGLGLYGC